MKATEYFLVCIFASRTESLTIFYENQSERKNSLCGQVFDHCAGSCISFIKINP